MLLLALAPRLLPGQDAAGTQLWRLAAATVPTPLALATGATAGWWTPAQADAVSLFALELVQTPPTAGASGFLAAARLQVTAAHRIDVAYGRMAIRDLVRTTLSPDPDGTGIDYYAHTARASWAGEVAGTTLGAALAYHETRLDDARADRWTLDFGVRRAVGGRLVLGAATHWLGLWGPDPGNDVYGGAQLRVWHGELWPGSGRAVVYARYGVTFPSGLNADHQIGTGLEIGGAFAADLLLEREGGYGVANWRPVAGVQVRAGRYRVQFSGNTGPPGLGAAYRVGLEARLRR